MMLKSKIIVSVILIVECFFSASLIASGTATIDLRKEWQKYSQGLPVVGSMAASKEINLQTFYNAKFIVDKTIACVESCIMYDFPSIQVLQRTLPNYLNSNVIDALEKALKSLHTISISVDFLIQNEQLLDVTYQSIKEEAQGVL